MLYPFRFLARPAPRAAPAGRDAEALAPIRCAMLESLGAGGAAQHADLVHRIRYALEAQRLWNLRPELMLALASIHGEAHAACALERISAMFQGVLPQGLASGLGRRRSANGFFMPTSR